MRDAVWGQGFPAPAFDDAFDVVAQRAVGDGHAKLTLARGGERFDGDRCSAHAEPLPPRIHALFRPEVNDWNGLQSLELVIELLAAGVRERGRHSAVAAPRAMAVPHCAQRQRSQPRIRVDGSRRHAAGAPRSTSLTSIFDAYFID